MKNELQLLCENRLKQVLFNDKKENPQKVLNIIKSEILYVLKNYMEIKAEDMDININLDEFGTYSLEISAKINRLKMVSSIS